MNFAASEAEAAACGQKLLRSVIALCSFFTVFPSASCHVLRSLPSRAAALLLFRTVFDPEAGAKQWGHFYDFLPHSIFVKFMAAAPRSGRPVLLLLNFAAACASQGW